MRRPSIIAVAVLALAVSACGTQTAPEGDAGSEVVPFLDPVNGAPALPDGWRWESYGGVQVGVPDDWGWGNGSQRLGQWCINTKDEIAKPIIGRPGASTAVGCFSGEEETPSPETLIAKTGLVVGFDRIGDSDGVEHAGDRTTVRLNGVLVAVQAPQKLREQIVATIHPVVIDSYGCPVTHPISGNPQQRPEKPVDVASLRGVSAVSACKYEVGRDPRPEPRLISGLRLEGAAAEQAIKEIVKAPLGGGPNEPARCLPDYSYGEEIVVLLVRSALGSTEIVLRYSGCDHHGFDDGVSVRSLTAKAVRPFVAGPNTVLHGSSAGMLPILRPTPSR